MQFKAIRVMQHDAKISGSLVSMQEQELSPVEITIAVEYSSVNYKDALAVTGRGKIMRKLPLNAGIDLAGEITASSHPE